MLAAYLLQNGADQFLLEDGLSLLLTEDTAFESRYAAIEAACFAQLQTLRGFAELQIVSAGMLLNAHPELYPAGWLSVLNAKKTEGINIAGHTSLEYDVEFGVLIYASGDGIHLGDARLSAWSLVDAVMDVFVNFQPSGIPALTSVWPVMPGDPQNVINDTGLSAIYVPFSVRIRYNI